MELKTVELYQALAMPRQPGESALLHCYIQHTSGKVSPHRLRPGVLILPGGGYGHVSPREGEPVALRLLAAGCSAFVLEYSVAPHRFPTQLRQAAMAMRYLRENMAAFGLGCVAAMGFSAGGHLCLSLGTLFDSPEVADIAPAALLRPDALGLCYPVVVSWGPTHQGTFQNLCGADETLRRRVSLEARVRRDMPPVFLWHTRDDASVPVRNSVLLAQALEAAGIDFALHIYRRGKHGLSTADRQAYPVGGVPPISADVPGWLDAMLGFFEEIGITMEDQEEQA